MTVADKIADEIGKGVVVDKMRGVYWVDGVREVNDLPPVDGVSPIPDPSINQS